MRSKGWSAEDTVGDTGPAVVRPRGSRRHRADRRGFIRRGRWPPAQLQGLSPLPRGTMWTRLARTWSAKEDVTRPSPGSPRAVLTPQSRGQDSWAVPHQVSLVPVRPSSPLYHLPPLLRPWGPEPRPGACHYMDPPPPPCPPGCRTPTPRCPRLPVPNHKNGAGNQPQAEKRKIRTCVETKHHNLTQPVGQRTRRRGGRTQVEVNGLKSRAWGTAAGRRDTRTEQAALVRPRTPAPSQPRKGQSSARRGSPGGETHDTQRSRKSAL